MTEADSTLDSRLKLDGLLRARTDVLIKPWLVATVPLGAGALTLSMLEFFSTSRPHGIPGAVRGGLALLSLLLGAASFLPKRKLDEAAIKTFLHEPFDVHLRARKFGLDANYAKEFVELGPSEQRVFSLSLLFEQSYKQSLLFSAAPGALGFLYGLLSKSLVDAAPFLVASLVLNCVHYPRLRGLIDRGYKLENATEDDDALHALAEMKEQARKRAIAARRPAPRAKPPGKA